MKDPTPHPFKKFLRDLFTGPDGETWALPRFFAIPTAMTGLGVPIYALTIGQPVSLADLGLLLPATAGAVLLLIRGANNIDDTPHPPPPTQGP